MRFDRFSLALVFVSFLVNRVPFAYSEATVRCNRSARVHLMANMGDSLSSASLADSSLNDYTVVPPVQNLLDGLFGEGVNKNTLSWAGGDQISSHFKRLLEWFEIHQTDDALKRINVSVPGAQSHGLKDQAGEILELLKTGKFKSLKYVTLTMGGNDICFSKGNQETDDEVFKKNLEDMFALLASIEQEEPIHFLVSSIPKIPDLGRPEIAESRTAYSMTCKSFRAEVHSYCENLLSWTNEEEYNQSVARVAHKNELLRQALESAVKEYPKIQAVFSPSFFEITLQPDWLSVDCFHPNKKGQEILSELLWNDQPWFH